jgi:signal transduction histidine kinase
MNETGETHVNSKSGFPTRRAIFPLLFLLTGLLILASYFSVFPSRTIGFDGVLFNSALALTSFILMLLFQRFEDSPRLHVPLSVGWGFVFLGSFEKLVSEFVSTDNFENENLFSAIIFLGLLFIAFGIYAWIRAMWQNEHVRDQQHRVIELYSSLMTHDAGNDLQAIQGYLEVSLSKCQGCDKQTKEYLEAALASTKRMSNLIKSFKTGVVDTNQPFVLLLREIIQQAETSYMDLEIELDVGESAENVIVAGDRVFSLALENLIRNSAEHAGPNPRVLIKIKRVSKSLMLEFFDNGPGISPPIRARLFNRDRINGSGIGLYLARQIVQACNGSIRLLESETGVHFEIVLPLSHFAVA